MRPYHQFRPAPTTDIDAEFQVNIAGVGDGDRIGNNIANAHPLFNLGRAVGKDGNSRIEGEVNGRGIALCDNTAARFAQIPGGFYRQIVSSRRHSHRIGAAIQGNVKAIGIGNADAGIHRIARHRIGDFTFQETTGGAVQVHGQRHSGYYVDEVATEFEDGRVVAYLIQ